MGDKLFDPTHPKYIKKGRILYDKVGRKFKVIDIHFQLGVWYLTISDVLLQIAHFEEWDEHDYSGYGGSPLLEYSIKKPRRK